MESWDLAGAGEGPSVLLSSPEVRCVVLDVDDANGLDEHQMHERTLLVVIDGAISVTTRDGVEHCSRGSLVHLEPREPRRIQALERARLLLVLAPWPAAGHYQPGEHENPHELPASATLPARAQPA
jgi:quercetin dioxygenase-like cupin family protein